MPTRNCTPRPEPRPDPERSSLPVDNATHRRCFDYALAMVAAGGDTSKLPPGQNPAKGTGGNTGPRQPDVRRADRK
jgi:hypothetical protein